MNLLHFSKMPFLILKSFFSVVVTASGVSHFANGKLFIMGWWDAQGSNLLPSRCQRDILPMN